MKSLFPPGSGGAGCPIGVAGPPYITVGETNSPVQSVQHFAAEFVKWGPGMLPLHGVRQLSHHDTLKLVF